MELEEFAQRYKARILQRLSGPGTIWTEDQAREAAIEEWESVEPHEHMSGFEDDPEGAADESLSYWDSE